LNSKINKKVLNATKWSTITEIIARLLTPITVMVLARLLTPEAFGVVATVTMIISFAEMFSDAGFQKYLIQHEFKDEQEKNKNTTVAFWTNLGISLVIWLIIYIFSSPISSLVGNPGLEIVIVVACASLPLTSLSSIQMALYRRDFNYKTLFFVRVVGICIPFVITIPLALLGFSYWSLVIGTICGNLSNAIILTVKSRWKPTLFYDIKILKEMLSFSLWSLIEAISIWLTLCIDTFIVGIILSSYYLGIYKTSMSMVNGIMALITGATTSVLFSALSRLQNNREEYNRTFLEFQKIVGLFIFPMGVGIFLYRDFITNIFLGSQWEEAVLFIGLWGLISSITIVFSHYSSEVYRSLGMPKLSFLSQMLHLIVLTPVVYIFAKYGFDTLVYARSIVRIEGILVNLLIMYFVIKISPLKMIKNLCPFAISAVVMGGGAYLLQQVGYGNIWSIVSIGICALFYFAIIMLFSSVRKEILSLVAQRSNLKRQKAM
jgi:O-antigen/teichoic acid export membrane protein